MLNDSASVSTLSQVTWTSVPLVRVLLAAGPVNWTAATPEARARSERTRILNCSKRVTMVGCLEVVKERCAETSGDEECPCIYSSLPSFVLHPRLEGRVGVHFPTRCP